MQITLRNQEIAASIKALDFYSRIFIGQYGEIDFVLRQYRLGHEVDSQYEYARRQILYIPSMLIHLHGQAVPVSRRMRTTLTETVPLN